MTTLNITELEKTVLEIYLGEMITKKLQQNVLKI